MADVLPRATPEGRITGLSMGSDHGCYTEGVVGRVACWGLNHEGQLGYPGGAGPYAIAITVEGLTGVSQVAAAGSHTCARMQDGSVRCWGRNGRGQLGVAASQG